MFKITLLSDHLSMYYIYLTHINGYLASKQKPTLTERLVE